MMDFLQHLVKHFLEKWNGWIYSKKGNFEAYLGPFTEVATGGSL